MTTFIDQHLVRYEDLRPCTTAFIDTRTPGSKEKENFTIIGPGVSENPDQYVHITRPHGFNIGGARQPPACVNSQHSHDTAEVFVVHSGEWQFTTGESGTTGKVTLRPGDTISVPTQCFRGFTNVGADTGFLFAILGGDDPGRVTWAPYVFEQAKQYGLVLLENGALVDTAVGEVVPDDIAPMPATTAEMIQELKVLDSADLARCVVRRDDVQSAPTLSSIGPGTVQKHLLGTRMASAEHEASPPLSWAHGFQLTHLSLAAGASSQAYAQAQEEVLMVQSGSSVLEIEGHRISLTPGDVFTAPANSTRRLLNAHPEPCEIYVVHGGENPNCSLIDE